MLHFIFTYSQNDCEAIIYNSTIPNYDNLGVKFLQTLINKKECFISRQLQWYKFLPDHFFK